MSIETDDISIQSHVNILVRKYNGLKSEMIRIEQRQRALALEMRRRRVTEADQTEKDALAKEREANAERLRETRALIGGLKAQMSDAVNREFIFVITEKLSARFLEQLWDDARRRVEEKRASSAALVVGRGSGSAIAPVNAQFVR